MDGSSYQQLLLENQQLRQQNARLEQIVRELQKRIEELERTAKRQAAPFSKGEPKKKPKRPGRKSGEQHGKHAHRQPPLPDQVDEKLEAVLPDHCPGCGGEVVEDHLDQQFQTEIPRQPIVREFRIHCGHCKKCGQPLRGRHPLQTSDVTGAAQSQLGGDAQAAIVYLNKRAGMSHGKIADTFDKVFGITLTPGASAQVVRRAGTILQPVYEEIQQHIISSDHLTPDETGWRIGGHPAWLHGWVGDDGATLYTIDPQRSADVLEKVIGIDWSGSMTHDGFSSYERFEDVAHQQCVDHALRRARKLLEKQTGSGKIFSQQVIDLLIDALRLRDRFNEEDVDPDCRGDAYEDYVQRLRDLTDRPRVNKENARFARHLGNHAASWFLFLVDPNIPATNHRAEQALKTPIVNRKVWGGNRTKAGGKAQAITSSVLQTCQKKAIDVFQFIGNAFRGVIGSLFNGSLTDPAK
jgi:transposase